MSKVSVALVPEDFRPDEGQDLLISDSVLWLSTADAHKLRDVLCVMVGMPRRKRARRLVKAPGRSVAS